MGKHTKYTKEEASRIKKLLSSPRHWVKGNAAVVMHTGLENLVGYCLLGACSCCSVEWHPLRMPLKKVIKKNKRSSPDDISYEDIARYNDHPETTYEDIMKLVDDATEKEENTERLIT